VQTASFFCANDRYWANSPPRVAGQTAALAIQIVFIQGALSDMIQRISMLQPLSAAMTYR
jgi:hypothetical protein